MTSFAFTHGAIMIQGLSRSLYKSRFATVVLAVGLIAIPMRSYAQG